MRLYASIDGHLPVPTSQIMADFLVMSTSCLAKKRRSWTDLSNLVNLDDNRQRLRNGRRMWSWSRSPDIGLRLTASGEGSSISLEKLTLESSQWKRSTHRDNTPSPFLFTLIVPSRSFSSAQAFSASITHITSQPCRPSDPRRTTRRSLPWLVCSVPVCATMLILSYHSRKY